MSMYSPIVAMLWENWRLSRVEAAQRTALGIVLGAIALLLFGDNGPRYAFWILITLHAFIWFSIAKLNGGRFMDGYKPGFPFYLLYPRPVPTAVLVGVAMVYDALSCTALYLASAALLGFAFGQPLPLFTMTIYFVLAHLAYFCVQYSTSNRVVQWVGSMAFSWPLFFLLYHKVATPLHVEFSLVENTVLLLLCLVAFGLTVAGVARQRRGDAFASVPRAERTGGYPDWLINLFRFPCPTSSATRAQVWFELKSSGLPVLALGLGIAVLIFLLFAIGIFIAPVRMAAVSVAMVFLFPALLLLGGNAFGIRRRQGRMYLSAFEATQPCGTAHLAGVKVLVRTACVLAAMIMVAASLWISSSLIGTWGTWVVESGKDAVPGLLEVRDDVGNTLGSLAAYVLAALVVVASIVVTLWVASLAAIKALRVRYPRHVLVVASLLLSVGLALALFAWAVQHGIGSQLLLGAILSATGWIAMAGSVLISIYLLWRGIAERTLTNGYLFGAVVMSAALVAAGFALLHSTGAQLGGITATNVVGTLSIVLQVLIPIVLAPWALDRLRHM